MLSRTQAVRVARQRRQPQSMVSLAGEWQRLWRKLFALAELPGEWQRLWRKMFALAELAGEWQRLWCKMFALSELAGEWQRLRRKMIAPRTQPTQLCCHSIHPCRLRLVSLPPHVTSAGDVAQPQPPPRQKRRRLRSASV